MVVFDSGMILCSSARRRARRDGKAVGLTLALGAPAMSAIVAVNLLFRCKIAQNLPLDQLKTAGFKTSSHHCRKVVGVVFSAVRDSWLSSPLSLAAYISTRP
jgi:hypothetical protein